MMASRTAIIRNVVNKWKKNEAADGMTCYTQEYNPQEYNHNKVLKNEHQATTM